MHQTRYQLWSVDPLTDDARPLFGTYTRTTAQRIAAAYHGLPGCYRILELRPVTVEIPRHHIYACRVRFARTGRTVTRELLAPDAYAAFRQLAARFGPAIDRVAVWLYVAEMQAGDQPIFTADRHGRRWLTRRATA